MLRQAQHERFLDSPCSSFPPRLLKRPHHRRQQVFKDGSRAEVYLGGDLHARRKVVVHAVGDEVLGFEIDQSAVGVREVAASLGIKGVSFALSFRISHLLIQNPNSP